MKFVTPVFIILINLLYILNAINSLIVSLLSIFAHFPRKNYCTSNSSILFHTNLGETLILDIIYILINVTFY